MRPPELHGSREYEGNAHCLSGLKTRICNIILFNVQMSGSVKKIVSYGKAIALKGWWCE